MKKLTTLKTVVTVLLMIGVLFKHEATFPCTIVSAMARSGHMWNMNNEDGPFGFANFINVFPKSTNAKYGYYTLSFFSPEFGTGGSIQGGTNLMALNLYQNGYWAFRAWAEK